ncbi:ParB N-terminal domain-containing protein [Bradyrhizobium zhanjiangense]|uniref:Uncharacterized protein n=1 Tax=Bradyrhizobium zhanjiangense TaxID=1325107 RepID=A0A4Q0Q7V1_9BRAD|nr:ParB N-terminal domain-containing protein [Bradyrhizobium zhanjiangense]RXG84843.1 hypothetical protein EAS61_37855 [Bradyrhizobium zhanjiangense]
MLEKASTQSGVAGALRLKGQDIPTRTVDVDQRKLQFYVDNPRIYSLVRAEGKVPDQEEIWKQLLGHQHVQELIHDIRSNGGLIDPVVVRDGDFVVFEGNSRLAAYRFLASKDPIAWAKIRCTILPSGIDEKLIFALLGQYHVKGKKDWAPYEKAGFLYRRQKEHGVDLSTVALDLGIPNADAKHLTAVYKFMMDHDDRDRDHWSYYDQYLRSSRIKKAREEFANLDDFIVGEIKKGAMPKALEFRDRLPIICTGPKKNLKRYIDGKVKFEDAYENAVDAGTENSALKKLKRFREWVVLNDTEDDLLDSNKVIRDKMVYELKEIEKRSKKLKMLLEDRKNELGQE